MYESYQTLRIKEKAGIASAAREMACRKRRREKLPLSGITDITINIVITAEMEERLRTLDSLYEKVSRNQKVKEIILLDAFHSATIEGARTTVERVKKAYNEPKTKDDRMVINTIKGIQYAYDNRITMENIRTLWEIVIQDVCENRNQDGSLFRNGMVYVGSGTDVVHVPAPPEQIDAMMQELFAFENGSVQNVWICAGVLQYYFVYIHPFCDGNGRTARILTQSYLYHHGRDKILYLPLSRTINANLNGYYSKIREAEIIYSDEKRWMDITPFIDYMIAVFEECMMTSIKEENALTDRQKQILSKMQKRGKGTEITIASAAKILKISEQSAGRALNGLAALGYLDKIKRERRNIFILQ